MKKLFLLIILSPILIFGQSQNQPSLKWKQLSTNHFTVIFPAGLEDYAKQTALIIDTAYSYDTKVFIDNHPKHIDLLLYNQSIVSNAYAALAPRRMVWYTTPPQFLSLTLSPWNKVLAIHEFRHVTQYAKLNDGFTKLASTMFGQFGQAALQNWSVPNWYMEGDAVFNETKFSNSGRGRMPAFSLPVRTILLSDEKVSYEKALFRSYNTYYPNHYYLGYYMVSYINKHYGEDVWNNILFRSSLYSYWPYSFERSVKKYTGFNVRKTYKKAMHEVDSLWTEQLNQMQLTDAQVVNQKKKHSWTNYFDLQYVSPDTLIVLKSGFDDNSSIYYLFADGTEKKIREIASEDISYANGKIAWTQYKSDIRYGEVSYMDIVVYDLKTKHKTQITKHGKFLSVELSHDASKIVSVEILPDLVPKIVVMDINGKIIFEKEIKDANNVVQPTWTQDDKGIVFLQTTENGESMNLLNVDNQQITNLIPEQWLKFEKPKCAGNFVYFNYDYSGITNIYALDLHTKQIFQVTSRPFAAVQAVADNENIYFTDYTLDGLDICKMPLNKDDWVMLNDVNQIPVDYFDNPNTHKTITNINTDFSQNQLDNLTITDYKPAKHLVKIHSWTPVMVGFNKGMEIYSTDLLNTLDLTAAMYGNRKIGSLMGSAGVNFKKYFPVFSLNFATGKNGVILDTDTKGEIDSIMSWHETSANAGILVSLDLSKDIYARYFDFSVNSSFVSMTNFEGILFDDLGLKFTQALTFSSQMSFTNRRYRNYRDVYSSFGQVIVVGGKYSSDIFDMPGYQFYAKGTLYLPSIMRHDGFKIDVAYENKNRLTGVNYPFSNMISMPRGYADFYYENMAKVTVDYQLPLCYPNLNIPYLLFIKRIRAGAFFDYAMVTQTSDIKYLKTAGAELNFDFHIIRLNAFQFSMGARLNYLIDEEKFGVEMIGFNMNF